jgi:hypothetical protein
MTFEQFFIEQFLNRKQGHMPYNGRYHKGYSKTLRAIKRQEAEERNARTVPERRAAYRRLPISERTGLTPDQ